MASVTARQKTGARPPKPCVCHTAHNYLLLGADEHAVLHWFMQRVVKLIAWVMVRTLDSGAESLSAAGNILKSNRSPLLIKPFVSTMTRSELMAVMTRLCNGRRGYWVPMSVFFRGIPNIAGHLVIASIISAPAALAIAKQTYRCQR